MLPQGVTYCGESSASSLTMANVPWHEEVIHFVRDLVDLIPDYEIACEHEHSNCLLIAHKRVRRASSTTHSSVCSFSSSLVSPPFVRAGICLFATFPETDLRKPSVGMWVTMWEQRPKKYRKKN